MQRQPAKTDEWYTPAEAVEVIVPYLKGFKRVWCPFDLDSSNFVKVLKSHGFEVINTHIFQGDDFLEIDPPECDCIVSNPPYSLKQQILEKLFEIGKPFAMLMNVSGLYDSRRRFDLFKNNPVENLYIYPRVKFYNDENQLETSSPTYQSAYVCKGLLDSQIGLVEMKLKK